MNFFTCKWFVFTFEIFPDSSIGKESACSARDPSLIPGSGKSAGEGIGYPPQYSWAFLVAHLVKNPPAMWDTWVQSLGWEDPLRGKGYALQYSGLENSMNYSSWGRKELDTTEWLSQCWLLTLCKFHMYNIIFLLVYILQHTHYKKFSFHPSPSSWSPYSFCPTPGHPCQFSSGNHIH